MKKHIPGAVLISLISIAAQAEDSAVIPFSELDANHDDSISASEAEVLVDVSAQWSVLDANGDGQLSRAEYAVYELPAPAAGTE